MKKFLSCFCAAILCMSFATQGIALNENNGNNALNNAVGEQQTESSFSIDTAETLIAKENTTIDFDKKLVFTKETSLTNVAEILTCADGVTATTDAIESGFLGTGTVISVKSDNLTTEYTLISEGDIDGDGVCDVLDAARVATILSGFVEPTVHQIYAANGCVSEAIDGLSYQNVVNRGLGVIDGSSDQVPEETVLDEGKCGDNLYWQLNSEGELRIYGSGEMYDYVKSITPSPWFKYRKEPYITEDDKSILNSDGTHYDSTSRYYSDNPNNWRIKNIVIEEGVTYIGNWAFYRVCVEELTIPEGVEEMGYFCVRFSPNIKKVNLPNSLKVLGDYAISRNYELTTVNIGNQLVRAGRGCFKDDTALTSVILPDTCVSINEVLSDNPKYGVNLSSNNVGFLEYCSSLKTVDFGSVESIPYNTCVRTAIETVVIPNTVKNIGSQAFYNCTSLKNVVFEEGSICTDIASTAFSSCTALESVTGGTALKTLGSYTLLPIKVFEFSDTNTTLVKNQFNGTALKTAKVGNNIESIPMSWMSGNKSLETLYISNNVKEINSAFTGCTSLTSIFYEGTLQEWKAITKTSGWNYQVPTNCTVYFSDDTSALLKETL